MACLTSIIEPLRAANTLARRPLYDWAHYALTGAAVHSSSGLPVQPAPLSAGQGGDYLMVMPSYGHRTLATAATRRALRAAGGRFHSLVGLDTGSWLLADAGLLDGHRATSNWDVLPEMAETYPEVRVVEDR